LRSRDHVTINGLDIPFWDLVAFMVKWTIATIPAGCILIALAWVVGRVVIALVRASF
jgi:hypothetical protein